MRRRPAAARQPPPVPSVPHIQVRSPVTSAPHEFLVGDRLYADVVTYSGLGEHRTATAADHRTSEWLAQQLRATGGRTFVEPYRLQQFLLREARLTVAGRDLEAFPLWWPAPTGPLPLEAPLRPASGYAAPGSSGDHIALVKLPEEGGSSVRRRGGHRRLIEAALSSGPRAILAVTLCPPGGIVALNARGGLEPWPVPVLLVGGCDEAWLDTAAGRGDAARVLLDGQLDRQAMAYNVVGRFGTGGQLVVVSTPSSGWFRCAGERGPGIALFLALARWAAQRDSEQGYLFVATSGHELDAVGTRDFLARSAPPPSHVKCWLHLGAGIATWDYEMTPAGPRRLDRPYANTIGARSRFGAGRRLMCVEELAEVVTRTFDGVQGLAPTVVGGESARGELALFVRAGYRAFGFGSGSVYHHMPGDLPDRATGPELLEPIGRALVQALTAVERI